MKAATGTHPVSRLLYVTDNNSRRRFLVDTGAAVSIYPASKAVKQTSTTPSHGTKLVAANSTHIRTYGQRRTTIDIGILKSSWPFILADVDQPIIGADFLAANNLWVDPRGHRLINAET